MPKPVAHHRRRKNKLGKGRGKMLFTAPKPNIDDEFLAGRIEAWLKNHGYIIGPAGVTVFDGNVTIDCDRDPSGDIANYQPTDLAEDADLNQAVQELKAALALILAKAEANRTPAERGLLALAKIVKLKTKAG